jgi:hypothetical protein
VAGSGRALLTQYTPMSESLSEIVANYASERDDKDQSRADEVHPCRRQWVSVRAYERGKRDVGDRREWMDAGNKMVEFVRPELKRTHRRKRREPGPVRDAH